MFPETHVQCLWLSSISWVSRCLPEDELLQLSQFIFSQSFPDSIEAKIVLKIVPLEENPSWQLIGHAEVADLCPTMILTAITGTALNKRTKIIMVFFSFRFISKDVSGMRLVVVTLPL